MMTLQTLLQVAGGLQIALAALHLLFPKRFAWKEELARLSLLNRQIFLVHTIFVCLVLVLIGSLSLFASAALLEASRLSHLVAGGIAVFWGVRLAVQFFVYDSKLWRGSPFNTAMHLLFTALWMYLTAVYASLWWLSR
jgi:hypothetical protein